MLPHLVPEISPLDAFCDGAGGAGIGEFDMKIKKTMTIEHSGKSDHTHTVKILFQ